MVKKTPLTALNFSSGNDVASLVLEKPEKAAIRHQPKAKGRDGRQFIAAHVNPEAAKQFKLLALQQERTVQNLLIEAINDLFNKHGMSRIAEE